MTCRSQPTGRINDKCNFHSSANHTAGNPVVFKSHYLLYAARTMLSLQPTESRKPDTNRVPKPQDQNPYVLKPFKATKQGTADVHDGRNSNHVSSNGIRPFGVNVLPPNVNCDNILSTRVKDYSR